MLKRNMMKRSLHYIAIEARDLPMYDRLSEPDDFLKNLKEKYQNSSVRML